MAAKLAPAVFIRIEWRLASFKINLFGCLDVYDHI